METMNSSADFEKFKNQALKNMGKYSRLRLEMFADSNHKKMTKIFGNKSSLKRAINEYGAHFLINLYIHSLKVSDRIREKKKNKERHQQHHGYDRNMLLNLLTTANRSPTFIKSFDGFDRMELFPRDIRPYFPKIDNMEGDDNPIAWLRFFDPATGASWYILAADPIDDEYCDFCLYARSDQASSSYGLFKLSDLELENPHLMPRIFPVPLERELLFKPRGIMEVKVEPNNFNQRKS